MKLSEKNILTEQLVELEKHLKHMSWQRKQLKDLLKDYKESEDPWIGEKNNAVL
jgi:peptidoglycan hydrolase CwlO-like protein